MCVKEIILPLQKKQVCKIPALSKHEWCILCNENRSFLNIHILQVQNIDFDGLFGNINSVIDLSRRLYKTLQDTDSIGQCKKVPELTLQFQISFHIAVLPYSFLFIQVKCSWTTKVSWRRFTRSIAKIMMTPSLYWRPMRRMRTSRSTCWNVQRNSGNFHRKTVVVLHESDTFSSLHGVVTTTKACPDPVEHVNASQDF